MKNIHRIIFGLCIAGLLSLFVPPTVFCQTETLDIVSYTPPKGWTKTPKEGATTISDINKITNGFCVVTVYAGTPSSGSPQKDFTNQWNESAVIRIEPNPARKPNHKPRTAGLRFRVRPRLKLTESNPSRF